MFPRRDIHCSIAASQHCGILHTLFPTMSQSHCVFMTTSRPNSESARSWPPAGDGALAASASGTYLFMETRLMVRDVVRDVARRMDATVVGVGGAEKSNDSPGFSMWGSSANLTKGPLLWQATEHDGDEPRKRLCDDETKWHRIPIFIPIFHCCSAMDSRWL
jgi:hypothetical protein